MWIRFIPESEDFGNAAKQYDHIWQSDGKIIVASIEQHTSLKFKEIVLEATVAEGISQSHPFRLRASYDLDIKKATLVHELLHRLSYSNHVKLPAKDDNLSLELHKQIYLVLYDIWTDLYGTEFADRAVVIESGRTSLYKQAWDWALSHSPEQRKSKFATLIN